MYVNKKTGNKLSVQDMQKYADENEVSIEEYARDFGFVLEEVAQDTTSADLLDPTTFQKDAAADADVVSQPMTASQAEYVEPEDTELAPVDTSLDSPDPDPTKILPPGVESINTDEENYNERLARLNAINDKKNKLKDQLIEFAKLEIPDEKQASDYVKKNLEDFDKQNQTEKELIFSNKEFKLQQDALEQLRKDTGSNKAAGRGFGGSNDVVDYFKYVGRAFGVIDLRTEEASEVIKINKEVENAIATSLPKKDLQKLAMGVYTLQEKENLINEYKLPIIQNKTEELGNEIIDLKNNAENTFGKIQNRQIEINKELSIIKNRKPNKNYTQEEVNIYNKLSSEFKQLEDSKPGITKKFEDNFKAINIRKEILEGDYNVNLSKNVIYNNFELTNKVEKYREQFAGEGFWNAASDIILGDALGGLYSTIKKGTIGGTTFLATAYFDAFTDPNSYSRIDGFRDLITNFTDYSLLPASEDEKFSITKEEGGLKDDVSARSLLKLGAQMVPFTGYLMMEAKKGNMSGVKQGVGRYLQGLKGSAKILTPLGKSLKNEVILADAAFRATILDNAKEAKNKGLDGVAADTYATTISLTEGVVQSIMPDVNFLKGTQGKAIKDAFIGNLKNVANKKAASTAAKEFFTNIGKEFVEEEITYGLNLMTDASFGLALPKGSEFLNAQIELAAGTIMLSGGMGSVGGVKTFSNQKKLIYNQISKNIISTDAYLQKMQETVIDPDTKLEIEKARKFARSIHSAVEKSPENVTANQIDLLVEKSKLIEEKKKTDSAFHPAIDEKIKNINEKISNSAIEKSAEQNFEKDIKLLEKSMQSAGLKSDETIVFEGETIEESQAKQKDYLINVVGKTEKFAEENKDSNGMFVTTKDGKEVFLVNKNTALGSGIVTTGQHEFLHKVLKSALQSNPELIEKAAKSLTEEISKMVGGKEALLGTDWFKRWNSYTALVESGDYTENDFYEEALPLFSEALSNKELNYDPDFLTKIKDIFRQLFQNVGLKGLDFESGEGVKNFIIDYNKAYSKGKFKGTFKSFGKTGSVESARKAKKLDIKVDPKIKTNDKLSKQLTPEQDTQLRSDVAEIKKEASESEALAKKFNKDFIKGAKQTRLENKVLNEIKPVVERVITNRTKALYDPIVEDAKKLVSREMFQESMRSDIETMVLNEFTGKQDIEKFIVNRGFLRANNLAERLGIKNAEEGIDKNLDTAKTILVEETEKPKTDRPRYRNILKSNVLPTETTAKVKDKVLKTVRTLKSKLNTKISINKTVTPLIAEIKENMGKQADIDFKKAMGGKKDGQLKRFLIKNKKAILENMTTTWLVKAMPGAIQKQVDGNFTSDWQGKKIDREKTTTQQAGRTSGAEIVRRLPNAFKNLDDKTYLGYVVDESGAPIRGRKESLAKAMAEELSFDIFAAEIQDENSEISRAFESNQEALGEVLADNFVQQITRDAERGTVKFSMSAKSKSNIKELLNSEIENIKAKNPKYNDSIEYILNTKLLKELDEIKTIEDLLKTLYSETVDTYGSTNIANRARIKILNLIARNENNTISFEEIFNTFQKAVTRDLWKYEKQVIGFGYSLTNLENNIKKDRVKAIKDWFKYDSRVIRTQKIQNITRNLDAFNYLKSKGIVLDGFEVTFNDNKTRSYIEYKGERLFNLTDVTDIKKNFELKADIINKEANESTNYMLNTIEKGVKNNDIGALNGWVALMYEDQRGPVRKSSKTGKFVKNYKELKLADLILEHETEAYYIYKAYQDLVNNYSEAKVQETKNFLDKAFVNLVSKEIDADLKAAKEKGLNNKDRYRKSDKQYNLITVKFSKSTQILDPKGKVYKPDIKFSKTMNSTFNKMLERKTGIAADETLSRTIANRRGVKKGKYKFFMPSSLDDFKGLTSYTFAGKGKQGEADQKFFQDTLIDPYFKGIRAIEETRQAFKDDFRALNKQMKPVIKKLGKLVPGTEFTHDQAIRVALWTASGYEIPGISEIDQKKLVDYVNDNADLSEYARKLQQISKRPKWAKPGDFWDAETILSDLNNLTEKVGRKEFLSEFIENADIIFSEENLNKVQAGYGKATRDALEDVLYRMKNGTNRPSSTTDNTNTWNTWVNNSIGAIMFFNRRSALLQTLSTVNFINWSDNNPLKAAAAFANQKQYWSDFAMLFNSSKLKQRRSGLKGDVNEAEIAKAVKGSKNKAVAALSYLLKIGFTPTQMADSFAIAAGGATFYRNRVKSYLKKVNKEGDALYTKEQAEEMAFKDFSQISEETQQSGDPALISSDQASTAGRLILSFQNTPIQLNRSIKKAALDIKNRRRTPGQTMLQSDFSNFSKIIYYGTVQNIIFSALQNALFALIPGFEDEDDELTEKEQLEKYGEIYSTKQSRIVNGMIDTTLKGGFGFPGAIISTVKNAYLEYDKQEKKKFMADHTYTILALFNLAPSVGSKGRKIYSAIQTKRFEKDVIEKRDWDITIDGKFNLSPSYKVLGGVVEGFTNLPLDRAVTEVNALTEALDYRNTVWQRVALALGWRTWDVGAENEEHELIKTEAKAKRKEEGKIKAKETRAKNKKTADAFYKKVGKTLSRKEKQKYFSFSGKTRRREYLDEIAKQKGIK